MFCKGGDFVLDPFAGGNTTGKVANSLEREFISITLKRGGNIMPRKDGSGPPKGTVGGRRDGSGAGAGRFSGNGKGVGSRKGGKKGNCSSGKRRNK